jgi:polysaccharide biosynthesis/export protein
MISIFGKLARRWPQGCSLAHCGRALAIAILLACTIEPAAGQSPASQPYRIAAGDKVAVVVFGQPDLSGESTVDQGGNIRLPIIGELHAATLTPSELEKSITRSLEQGYVRRPVVSVKIAEFRPIYVLGMVRTPGPYPYREGQSLLAAIAHAGGIGAADLGGAGGDAFQADERVRLLEISRAALLAKRARLVAQQNGDDRIDFQGMSGLVADPARIAQIRDGEQRAFVAERQAEQQETEALQKQFPRLDAEIASLKQQAELERQQRELNKQLIEDYEKLAKSGLARKPTYIEIKREEARIEGSIARLQSEALRAELAIGDLRYKIAELHNNYQRRVMTELRETDRLLLELTVTLPSARRARAARAGHMGWLTGEQGEQLAIAVIRAKGTTTVKYDAAADFPLQPGDVVQVGSLVPPTLEPTPNQVGASRQEKPESETPLRTRDATTASQGATIGLARPPE